MGRISDLRKSDEQKQAEAEKKANLQREVEKEAQIIRKTFATEDGRRCLRIIMNRCKYQSPITIVSNDGVIHTENLQHSAALQGLYLWLRQNADKDILAQVEVLGFEEDKENHE